jgi:hypothetical protein
MLLIYYFHLGSNKALGELDKRAFRLPATLERNLAARRLDLHAGSGILLLRGLRPDQRSQRENFILFAGLASHLSEQRGRQSGKKYLGMYLYLEQGHCGQRANLLSLGNDQCTSPTLRQGEILTNIQRPIVTTN